MSIPLFTIGYPPDGSSLGNTKAIIRNNLDGMFQVFGVDHFSQNTGIAGAAGKHGFIRMLDNPSHATTTAVGEIAMFNGRLPTGSDYNLCYNPSNSTVPTNTVQLTRSEKPSNTSNGFSWIPGNILVQWGSVTTAAGGAVVTYPTPFTTAVYSILLTPTGLTLQSSSKIVYTADPSGTQPLIRFNITAKPTDVGTLNPSFYWYAIGS